MDRKRPFAARSRGDWIAVGPPGGGNGHPGLNSRRGGLAPRVTLLRILTAVNYPRVERRRVRMTGATDFDIATLRARRTNNGTSFPPTCCRRGSPTSILAWRLDHRRARSPDARPGIWLCRARRRVGPCVCPPNGATFRLAYGSRRHARDRRLVQASFSSVMAFSEPGDAVLCSFPPIRLSCALSRTPGAV